MKKISMALASIIFLLTLLTSSVFAESVQPAKPGFDAYINVAAATLWSEPGQARKIDAPSLSTPVDLRKWTTSMNYDEKLWLVGELETQALYGQKVSILEEKGNWVKVAVHAQLTPRNSLGYPGWMPKSQLTVNPLFLHMEKKPFALVKSPTAWLFHDKNLHKKTMEISYNTRLPVAGKLKKSTAVFTPDGSIRWIKNSDIQIYKDNASIPAPTGSQLVEEAKKFIGLPYLWAGASGFGFDCSGFTSTLYQAAGITIPRDSGPQSKAGIPVPKDHLQKGDLLFFAHDNGKGSVHHVAMYIGNGYMIHSPNTSTTVRIDRLDNPVYAPEFAGARRYLNGK